MFRIAGSIVAATIVSLTLSIAVTGCSSDSNSPADSGSQSSTCDLTGAEAVFTAKCTMSGCHNSSDKTSGLDLTAGSDLPTRLVGVMPMSISFFCAGAGPYLTAKTNPATGLLLDKITKSSPSCGQRMPFGMAPLTTAEISCIQSWANTVTQ